MTSASSSQVIHQTKASVEVAPLPHGAAARDSKDSAGPVQRFTAAEWRAFIGAIKDSSL
jgi:hypothetical protein